MCLWMANGNGNGNGSVWGTSRSLPRTVAVFVRSYVRSARSSAAVFEVLSSGKNALDIIHHFLCGNRVHSRLLPSN